MVVLGAEGKIPNNDLFISFTVQNKAHNRINKNIFIGINIKMLTLGSKLKLSLSLASWGDTTDLGQGQRD